MNALYAVFSALLAFYSANEALGLFLFLMIEEAGLPLWFLPGDALVIAAGAQPGRTPGSAALILLSAAVGVSLGSTVLYAIARRGGRPLLDRYGRFLHLNAGRVTTVEGWFQRYGALAIVAGRLIPGFRTPTTVLAGLLAVPYRVFAPATAVAAVLWAALYFFAGAVLQSTWRNAVATLTVDLDDAAEIVVLLLLLAVAAGTVVRRVRTSRATTKSPRQSSSPAE
jgi:membrane protein DedA with SNARE-associated domain